MPHTARTTRTRSLPHESPSFAPSRLPLAFAVAFAFSGAACKPRSFNDVKSDSAGDTQGTSVLRPHSPDHLVFALEAPTEAGRAPGKTVGAKVLFVPEALKGKLKEGTSITLDWKSSPQWLERVHRDVAIPEESRAKARSGEKRDVLPWALNGWKEVGPLESLAAARAVDAHGAASNDLPIEIRVLASTATIDAEGKAVTFEGSPEVVEGTHVALVKIVGVIDEPEGKRLDVLHYEPSTKTFSRKVMANFRLGPHTPLPTQEKDSPAFVPEDAARSRFNEMGWYAYGEWVARGPRLDFQVRALEPRALTVVSAGDGGPAPLERVEPDKAADYFKNRNWTDQTDAKLMGTETRRDASARGLMWNDAARRALIGEAGPEAWTEGTRGLLVHVFSWRGKEAKIKASTGHFAFGEARVVKSPFVPGELKFETVYRQVYGQGPDAVVAASHTWASYMGSLQRGFMFQVPVSDFVVRHPALTDRLNPPGSTGGYVFLDALQQNLETMMAIYRTGDGTGQATIDPVTSCVQDANFALYLTYMPLHESLSSIGKTLTVAPAEKVKYDALIKFFERLNRFQFGMVRTQPSHWRAALKGGPIVLALTPVQRAPNALISMRTAIPRGTHDALGRLLSEIGGQVWVMRSSQIGGGNALPLVPPRTRLNAYEPDTGVLDLLFSN